MVGTISLILALNDSMILNGADLGDVFFNYLRSQPNRKYLYMVTLQSIDLTKSSSFPCIVSGKIPMASTDTYHPSTWGHILISSMTDGSLTILKLVDRSSKMPAYKENTAKKNVIKQNRPESGTVFDYPYFRRELKIGKDILLKNGNYAIGVISGDIMSEFQKVVVISGSSTESRNNSLDAPPQQTVQQDAYLFAKSQYSPPVPIKPGIALAAIPQEKAQKGKPFMVYGSIRIAVDKASTKKIPLKVHMLVSGPDQPDLSHYQIAIPATMQKKENDCVVAYFAFDCMKEFFYQEGDRFDVPEFIYVSAIIEDLHAGPVKMVTQ